MYNSIMEICIKDSKCFKMHLVERNAARLRNSVSKFVCMSTAAI